MMDEDHDEDLGRELARMRRVMLGLLCALIGITVLLSCFFSYRLSILGVCFLLCLDVTGVIAISALYRSHLRSTWFSCSDCQRSICVAQGWICGFCAHRNAF